MGAGTQHRYTVDELKALRGAYDAQLLTAAALIFSTQEIDAEMIEDDKQDIIEQIAVDVIRLRDAILDEIIDRSE